MTNFDDERDKACCSTADILQPLLDPGSPGPRAGYLGKVGMRPSRVLCLRIRASAVRQKALTGARRKGEDQDSEMRQIIKIALCVSRLLSKSSFRSKRCRQAALVTATGKLWRRSAVTGAIHILLRDRAAAAYDNNHRNAV